MCDPAPLLIYLPIGLESKNRMALCMMALKALSWRSEDVNWPQHQITPTDQHLISMGRRRVQHTARARYYSAETRV